MGCGCVCGMLLYRGVWVRTNASPYLARQQKLPSRHFYVTKVGRIISTTKSIKIDKKVHLAKMDRPYVGIRKNHTDQIKMDKKVHLAEMDLFVHF